MVLAETSAIFHVVYVSNGADVTLQVTEINLCRSETGSLASHKCLFFFFFTFFFTFCMQRRVVSPIQFVAVWIIYTVKENISHICLLGCLEYCSSKLSTVRMGHSYSLVLNSTQNLLPTYRSNSQFCQECNLLHFHRRYRICFKEFLFKISV